MEVVSADRLSKKIVHEYFTKLDQDTQQDIFHYVRNFVTDEQEKLILKYETEKESKIKAVDDSDDSDDEESATSNTSDDERVETEKAPTEEPETAERVLTPYDMETVDIISVYLHVRELYESTIKTPGFVSFWNFYHDMFTSR